MTVVADWGIDEVVVGGVTVEVRPLRPGDEPRVAEMFEKASDESVYLRFFSPVSRSTATRLEVATLGQPGHVSRVALHDERIVGSARYDVVSPGVAEVAFVVLDEYQGRGIATRLLEELAETARANDIHTFVAEVLPGNWKMFDLLAATGWERSSHFDGGVVHSECSIDLP